MEKYPRRIGIDICSDYDPTVMCAARKQESLDGAFWYDAKRQGYCSTNLMGGPWGIPILLDACPFCRELLPGPEARRRWEAKLEKPHPRIKPKEIPPERRLNAGDATAWTEDED